MEKSHEKEKSSIVENERLKADLSSRNKRILQLKKQGMEDGKEVAKLQKEKEELLKMMSKNELLLSKVSNY